MDYKLIIIIVLLLVAVVGYIRLYRHYRRNIKKEGYLLDVPAIVAVEPDVDCC